MILETCISGRSFMFEIRHQWPGPTDQSAPFWEWVAGGLAVAPSTCPWDLRLGARWPPSWNVDGSDSGVHSPNQDLERVK